jgi:hypothetical protein
MNSNALRPIFLLLCFFSAGCSVGKGQKTVPAFYTSGYASCDNWFWNEKQKAFIKFENMVRDTYFWYRDSLIIYENYVLDTETDAEGHTKYEFSILSYTFLDMRTRHAYDYPNFSDTATCTKSRIMVPDLRYGKIWAFLGEMPYANPDSTVRKMTDTVMNNVTYERFSMYETLKQNDTIKQVTYHYVYLNCNAAPGHRMFQFDKAFSRKYGNGCPIQWEATYYKIGDLLWTGGFVFHRDSLNENEHKVFDAWEKHAKQYPVKEQL